MTAVQPLSPEVTKLAADHELGALVRTFLPKRLNLLFTGLIWIGIVSVTVPFVLPGIGMLWLMRKLPGFNRKQAAKRLHLFEEGVIVNPPEGTGTVVLRWDSIRLYQDVVQTYVNGAAAYRNYTFVLLGKGASTTVTEFFADPDTWGSLMQDAVLRTQGPTALKSVLDGESMSFGDFTLASTGISVSGKGRLEWPQLQEVRLNGGGVHLMCSGDKAPWASDKVSKVANLQLFLALVQHFRSAGGRAA